VGGKGGTSIVKEEPGRNVATNTSVWERRETLESWFSKKGYHDRDLSKWKGVLETRSFDVG